MRQGPGGAAAPAEGAVPGYQHGGTVPRDMMAFLHEGEEVIPAGERGGKEGQGRNLITEQNRQMQELNANTEDQNSQMRQLTEQLEQLNQTLTPGGGGGGGAAGAGVGGGAGQPSGGGGGLTGRLGRIFGGGGAGGGPIRLPGTGGGGGGFGGGGATGTFQTPDVGDGNRVSLTGAEPSASGSPGAAVDSALRMQGLHEQRDRNNIKEYLRNGGVNLDPATTAWCSAFVNSSLQQQGIRGSGSAVATSFLNWGQAATGGIQRGDVLVQARGRAPGQTGGHVGLATGETRTTASGQQQIEMLSGNKSDAVRRTWENASTITARRAIVDENARAARAVDGGAPSSEQLSGTRVSPAALQNRLEGVIQQSSLAGTVPSDASRYGIRSGEPHEWAGLMTRLAGAESGYRAGAANVSASERAISAGAGSHGLFQLSPQDAVNYGLQDRPFTMAQLRDPDVNARAAVAIAEKRVQQAGTVGGRGLGAYWGPIKRGELDRDMGREVSHKVEGTGKLTVDVNAPEGTKVAAEGDGLFKTVETNRQTQMAEARSGPEA